MIRFIHSALTLLAFLAVIHQGAAEECAGSAEIRALASAADAEAFNTRLSSVIAHAPTSTYAKAFCRAVATNLRRKRSSAAEGVTFNVKGLISTSIEFERFRLETYLSSGVAPLVYFGFLDGQGRTREQEVILLDASTRLANLINDWTRGNGSSLRVAAKEIFVTHLAEGGALLLTDEYGHVNRVHPVRDIGLDDYRTGFGKHAALVGSIDQALGTMLSRVTVALPGRESLLLRPFTFLESLAATAIMYLYEKELTAEKMAADGRSALPSLTLDEQFVHTSLVYNSGILFSDERVRQIMSLDTAEYLNDLNMKMKASRPALPVKSPQAMLLGMANGELPPRQLTSWSAVYHIVQRYGSWKAISDFTDLFDERGDIRTEDH